MPLPPPPAGVDAAPRLVPTRVVLPTVVPAPALVVGVPPLVAGGRSEVVEVVGEAAEA